MKALKHTIILLLLLISSLLANSQKKCGFDVIYQELSREASFLAAQARLNHLEKISKNDKRETEFIVPVVIHVLYKNAAENITTTQIQSQLDVLNADYRKLNADTSLVEPGFSIADVKISFCLAKRDPSGNYTSGITRTQTNLDNVCDINNGSYYNLAKIWDPDRYLNIWVCDIDNVSAGYAFPPNATARNRDGVVIQYTNFGTTGSAQAPYDRGRTLTHEVGHWFNLLHLWGNSPTANCISDDEVADTPMQGNIYYGCPANPKVSCNSKDMLSNFMGYVDDRCMGNFTEGQKSRMRNTLVNARTGLLLSQACLPVGLEENDFSQNFQFYPNPFSDRLQIKYSEKEKMGKIELNFYNSQMQVVKIKTKPSAEGYELLMDDLPGGIYFLKISRDDEQLIKKLLKVQ